MPYTAGPLDITDGSQPGAKKTATAATTAPPRPAHCQGRTRGRGTASSTAAVRKLAATPALTVPCAPSTGISTKPASIVPAIAPSVLTA